MGGLFALVAQVFIFGQDLLGFVVFAPEKREVRLEGGAFGAQALIIAAQGREAVDHAKDFLLKLLGFLHGAIILYRDNACHPGTEELQ